MLLYYTCNSKTTSVAGITVLLVMESVNYVACVGHSVTNFVFGNNS